MPSHSYCRQPRLGGAAIWLLVLIAGASVGGWYWFDPLNTNAKAEGHDAILHQVDRNDFELIINERGTVESSGSTEIRSEVQSNNTGVAILRIIEEGSKVKEGDFLVELDSSPLLTQRMLQLVKVNTAEAAAVEAKNTFETAEIDREQYEKGLFVQEKQTIESEIFVKKEDLSRAEEYLKYSKKLAIKGYVDELQLQADAFAVEKSQTELEAANTKLRVLEEYTKRKELKTKDSAIVIAKAKWESLENNHKVELATLADIEDQIQKCTMYSPIDGIVTYAHENNRRGDGFMVEEGAMVRERQVIIRLPDITKMQVEVMINEALVQFVREGMPVSVKPVGTENLVLQGRVERVNQYAEPENWRRSNVKDYKAIISILGATERVKSGMTVAVSINSMYVPDVLQTPVESLYAHGDKTYCFVDDEGSLVAQEVAVGLTNDRFIVIESGLAEADRVVMNPRRFADKVTLPDLPPEQLQQAINSGKASRKLRKRLAAEETTTAAKTGKPGATKSKEISAGGV